MFNITSNGTIIITKGNTGKIILYINQGTKLEPERYDFSTNVSITKSPQLSATVTIDKEVWEKKLLSLGSYIFTVTYNTETSSNCWSLNSEEVNIEDYGIDVSQSAEQLDLGNYFIVTYTGADTRNEIYFNVWNINQTTGNPIIAKTIKPGYNTVLTSLNGEAETSEVRMCHTEDGDIIIVLNPTDTENIPVGEYNYTIKVKLLKDNELVTSTICSRTPFVVGLD